MKKIAAHSATSINNTKNTQTLNPALVGRTYSGTFWRIIIPVTIATFIGALLDAQLSSKPWMTLVGLVTGFMVATVLVKRQSGTEPAAKKQ
jgi:F0F1-type ATP synthase assembly protein I